MKKNETKLQIGLAIGWFVLLDVLLRTSAAALNTLGVSTATMRGLFAAIGTRVYSFQSQFSFIILGLLAVLVVIIINFVIQAWTETISLTRILLRFLSAPKTEKKPDGKQSDEETSSQEQSTLKDLLGDVFFLSVKSPIIRVLRYLMLIWFLLLVFGVFTNIVASMYAF